MNGASLCDAAPSQRPIAATWQRFRSASPALAVSGAALLVASVVILVPLGLDSRQWQGVGTWLKPWKFCFSLAVQLLTFALVMHAVSVEGRRRAGTRFWVAAAIVTALFEAIYITAMGGLNQGSHYNVATPAGAAMYALMGVGAVLLAMAGAGLGVQLARFPDARISPALKRGLVLALVLGWLVGTATGAVMSAQPNHWVGGLASDAGGLPLFGWSRSGGDLRVAHFAGVHATQAIALAAWWLQRRATSPPQMQRAWLGTVAFAAIWTLLTALLFAQAWAGRPLVAAGAAAPLMAT